MMEMIKHGAVALLMIAGSAAFAGENGGGLDAGDLRTIRQYAERHGAYGPESGTGEVQFPDETYLPNAAKPPISKLESRLLIKYMENPSDSEAAQVMAAYHLLRLPLVSVKKHGEVVSIEHIQRAIYAQYFLLRAKRLGAGERWIDVAIRGTERLLSAALPVNRALDFNEGNKAHDAFLEAFNYTEANRYKAEDALLKDLLRKPTNLLTNLYVSAVSLWNAGEAGYDDPVILYSYLKASYFGGRITELSKRAESEWSASPSTRELFRLAPAVGGFSLPSRRWLAKFHGDSAAVNAVNDELRYWLPKYPGFYMFPLGVAGFTEPENYFEGFLAMMSALEQCNARPNVFCEDNARVPYNRISFFMYAVDYFLKVGDLGMASMFQSFKYAPDFRYDTWYLGHDAWRNREDNFSQIAALYSNGDPADDPTSAFLKRHKWGPESSSCQLCHQVQGATFTEEEQNNIPSLPMEERYIGDWPISLVGWDASLPD
jgi:hypothetical protein